MGNDMQAIRVLKRGLMIKLKQLGEIDFSKNMPENGYVLDKNKNVTGLCLYKTGICDLSLLAKLQNLNQLNLSSNQISNLYDLAGLKNLNQLDLNSNRISDLTALAGLQNLKQLYLWNNQISNLSPLAKLENLNLLNLWYNKISDLSPLIRLKNLKQLDLRVNKISELPPEILDLNLEIEWEDLSVEKGINLYGNPLEKPPVEIVKQGRDAVVEYFKSLEGGKLPLNEVKVLLVGDGGAGKTSLMKRLIGKGFDINEKQTFCVKFKLNLI
mgnify:CR=1 FL=1